MSTSPEYMPDPYYDPFEMTPEEIKVHLAEVAPIECAPDITERALDGPDPVDAYVTEVSVPDFGDGGVQRLHNHLKGPEPEPEPEP